MAALIPQNLSAETVTPFEYSLDMLPVSGVNDPTQTVDDARGRLSQTGSILQALQKAPFAMSQELRQAIDNIKFSVVNGLYLIDGAYSKGYNAKQPYVDIPGLTAAIDNHLLAISKARPIWATWLKDAQAQWKTGDPPLPIVAKAQEPLFPTVPGLLDSVAGPSLKDYIAIGLVGVGALLLIKFFK
jgi:hypothetical protein